MITIIGGGISGLICGYYAKKNGIQFEILEKTNRVGGLIKTEETPYGKVEYAAHLFRASPAILEICNDLDIDLLEIGTKRKMFIKNNKITAFPFSPLEFISFISNILTKKSAIDCDANISDAGIHFFGNAGLKYFITPFINGIYACQPNEISQKVFFDGYIDGERPISFLKRKKKSRGIFTPRNGMYDIVSKLENFLVGHIKYNADVKNLDGIENPIITVDSNSASKILSKTHAQESEMLSNVKYSDVSLAWLFFDKPTPKAIGALSTDVESDLCGILFNHAAFPKKYSHNAITGIFRGNPSHEEMVSRLERVMGVKSIYQKTIFIPNAIPIYSPNLIKIQKFLQCSNVNIYGNCMGAISIADIAEMYARFF